MKIYNNPSTLQKIIKDSCNKEFSYLFESDVILKFDSDEDHNLILNNLDGGTINMDSNIAYQLSDYYKLTGDALKRIETLTGQSPKDQYTTMKGLGILFYEPFINFVNKEYRVQRCIREDNCEYTGATIDAIGGTHDEGLGWGPDGIYCGECSNITCETCGVYKRRIQQC